MKRNRCLFALFALLFAVSLSVQARPIYYMAWGFSPSTKCGLRFGMGGEYVGGGFSAKSDINRLTHNISNLDGTTYRLSLLGELDVTPLPYVMLTATAGYGAAGTYCVDASHTYYGVQGVKQGLEVGGGMSVILGGILFYFHYTVIPSLNNTFEPFVERTIGVGFRL